MWAAKKVEIFAFGGPFSQWDFYSRTEMQYSQVGRILTKQWGCGIQRGLARKLKQGYPMR